MLNDRVPAVNMVAVFKHNDQTKSKPSIELLIYIIVCITELVAVIVIFPRSLLTAGLQLAHDHCVCMQNVLRLHQASNL